MIKRTLKNVQRLKWASFAMLLFTTALALAFAKYAAETEIKNIVVAISATIGLPFGFGFWFIAFDTYMEIEQEIIDKAEGRNDH
jgi:hypothetical protein